jgi:hypothetical protein
MSHFVVMCLVPSNTDPTKLDEELEALLAPYSENIEMEEYETSCSCCGDVAERKISKLADDEFGTWASMKEVFATEKTCNSEILDAVAAAKKEFLEKNPGEEKDLHWIANDATTKFWQRDYWGPRNKFEKEQLESHPEKNTPNPTCGFYSGERADWWEDGCNEGDRYPDGSGCGGTGRVMSTYNPKSKWDWYSIGGRWNGYFKPEYNPNKDPENLEECIHCSGTGRRRDTLALGWERNQLWAEWIKDSGLTDEEKEEQMAFFVEKEGPLGFGQKTLDEGGLLGWIAEQPDAVGEPIGLAFRAIREKVHKDGRECNACKDGKAIKFPSYQKQQGVIAYVRDVLKLNKDGHDVIPYAILTHREDYEKQWLQRGEMGWFGTSSNEVDRDEWRSQALQVLEDHMDDCAVVVDCHI